MDYCMFRRKYLLGCLGKLGEVLRQHQVKEYNQTITLSTQFLVFGCFPWQAMLKSMPENTGHCGLKPG